MYEISGKCEPSSAENTTQNEDSVSFLFPGTEQIFQFSSVHVCLQLTLTHSSHIAYVELQMHHPEQYNTTVILLHLNFVKVILLCKCFLCVSSYIWKMAS